MGCVCVGVRACVHIYMYANLYLHADTPPSFRVCIHECVYTFGETGEIYAPRRGGCMATRIHASISIYLSIYLSISIYIEREIEREREREREKKKTRMQSRTQ